MERGTGKWRGKVLRLGCSCLADTRATSTLPTQTSLFVQGCGAVTWRSAPAPVPAPAPRKPVSDDLRLQLRLRPKCVGSGGSGSGSGSASLSSSHGSAMVRTDRWSLILTTWAAAPGGGGGWRTGGDRSPRNFSVF